MCGFCDIVNVDKIHLFTDIEIDNYLYQLYKGNVSIDNLDLYSYNKVAEKLTDGVFKGFGKNISNIDYDTPDYKMLSSLRENVYVFSGAKQYQQVRELSSLLTNDKGILSFNEFKKVALPKFKDYNENYLRAEYNSAIAQSQSARNWMEIENSKDLYPQLEYQTAGDGRVRPQHTILDGIIRTVNDIFWNTNYPPNDWNCRCEVLQVSDVTNTLKKDLPKITEAEVPEIFRFNSGKQKIVFSENHPYFNIAPKDKELALNNFNLPLPK
jgi:SPP1 gp7 family putative phage head morphogenesis protein